MLVAPPPAREPPSQCPARSKRKSRTRGGRAEPPPRSPPAYGPPHRSRAARCPASTRSHTDSGYQGAKFQGGLKGVCSQINIKIVRRCDQHRFVVLPKRWIAERTIAWLNRCRRLAKDWECLSRSGLCFLRWASVRLLLRRLCQTSKCSRMDSEQPAHGGCRQPFTTRRKSTVKVAQSANNDPTTAYFAPRGSLGYRRPKLL